MDIKKGIVSLTILTTLLISGCNFDQQEIEVKPTTKIVKIFQVEKNESYNKKLEYPSEIYAYQDATLAFEVAGKVTQFYFEEGQRINKGDIIAQLDDTIYKANYNSANVNYEQALLDYNKYLTLLKTSAISQTEVEKQKLNVELAKSSLEIAKQNLNDTKLVAEFDGLIAKKYIDDFERINAKQPIIKLQDNSSYKVKFFIPEGDILNFKQELTLKNISNYADFYVSVGGNKNIKANIISISTTAEKSTRTFETTLEIKANNTNILSGMTAKTIAVEKKSTNNNVFIPYQAVFTNAKSQSFAWLVDNNNNVHKQEITLGLISGDSVEILNGLDNNTKIVYSGVRFLNENDNVKAHEKLGR